MTDESLPTVKRMNSLKINLSSMARATIKLLSKFTL